MTLPYELLQYAENFYRRFPEEFLALGAPGMEEVYDLRPNSTSTRRIQESPAQKTVEITIRRWQGPQTSMGGYNGMPPQSYGYPQAPSYGPSPSPGHLSAIGVMQQQAAGLSASSTAAGHFGHPMYNGYSGMPPSAGVPSSGPPASPPRWQVELASHLVRLEGALSSLKPQIEQALLTNPQQQQQQVIQQASVPLVGSSDDASVHQLSATNGGKTPNSLSSRRKVGGLAIDTAPKAQAVPQMKTTEPPVVKSPPAAQQNNTMMGGMRPPPVVVQDPVPNPASSSPKSEKAEPTKVEERQRPVVNINPCRVAPAIQDPQSPRSPGRYSAWK